MTDKNNQYGFGLLEILVALGVAGILMWGIIGVNEIFTKTGQKSEQAETLNSLISFAGINLNKPEHCKSIFRNISFGPGTLSREVEMEEISYITKNNRKATLLEKNKSYRGLVVTGIKLVREDEPINSVEIYDFDTGIKYNTYLSRLSLTFQRSDSSLGPPTIIRARRGMINVSAISGNVISCPNGETPDPSKICVAMGGVWQPEKDPKCDVGAVNKGIWCGFTFAGVTHASCRGLSPRTNCPAGYIQKCWIHGGNKAKEPYCTCVRN